MTISNSEAQDDLLFGKQMQEVDMTRFRVNRSVVVTIAALLAVAIMTLNNSRTARAQAPHGSAPVSIVSPLPLPVTGQTTVSGTVAATQSGNWKVAVTNNVIEPGRSPFQQTVTLSGNTEGFHAIPTSPQACDFGFPL